MYIIECDPIPFWPGNVANLISNAGIFMYYITRKYLNFRDEMMNL